jgi:hypothetical protein
VVEEAAIAGEEVEDKKIGSALLFPSFFYSN